MTFPNTHAGEWDLAGAPWAGPSRELVGHLRVTRMVFPFDLVANQVVVGIGRLAAVGPFSCLLDTAAAPSVVDLTLARELGLRVSDDRPGAAAGQGSEIATFYPSELPDVRLGELEVGDVEAVAFDLSRLAHARGRSAQSGCHRLFAAAAWRSDPRTRKSRQRLPQAHRAHARLPTARSLHRRRDAHTSEPFAYAEPLPMDHVAHSPATWPIVPPSGVSGLPV